MVFYVFEVELTFSSLQHNLHGDGKHEDDDNSSCSTDQQNGGDVIFSASEKMSQISRYKSVSCTCEILLIGYMIVESEGEWTWTHWAVLAHPKFFVSLNWISASSLHFPLLHIQNNLQSTFFFLVEVRRAAAVYYWIRSFMIWFRGRITKWQIIHQMYQQIYFHV